MFVISLTLIANADDYVKSQNIKSVTLKKSHEIQKEIDDLDAKTKKQYEEYKKYTYLGNTQKRYNDQLSDLFESQESEKVILKSDIEKIEHTHKNIIPLMQKMIDNLEKFIEIDAPFLLKERTSRVKRLKVNIKRADLSVSDKYRQILEAYIIENDYAKTIESYKDTLNGKVVEFLRVGRVGLYYQTLDFTTSGMWDAKAQEFIEVDDSYNKKILNAIKISKKQLTPDLLMLPMIKGDM